MKNLKPKKIAKIYLTLFTVSVLFYHRHNHLKPSLIIHLRQTELNTPTIKGEIIYMIRDPQNINKSQQTLPKRHQNSSGDLYF